ncbi:DUF2726 domain-containing protein [Wohlfahrtiimonas larvae]|uniref:DUF2726 domain-containing protein n=1 Tax=Wohlfahrtiimonas larvae TaxID=1157986 RepID=A0ABP9MI68_9GAMM|nr:DUF2726 domain-containing protein [Wohlfahrtiimonas larvae]
MNSELIISSIFAGFKPVFPYLILVFAFVISITLLKIYLSNKFKSRLFNNTNFEAVRLLNKQEVKVYEALVENIQIQSNGQYRVFAQVSLGEILKNKDHSSFNRINQKRIDFCIVNSDYMPIAAIEYHGGGHFRGNYKERDEIKQKAVEYAGLVYHAIYEKDLNNIQKHIHTEILPLLLQAQPKIQRVYSKSQRIEPTFEI